MRQFTEFLLRANLIETISTQLNNIERITSTAENRIYNKFEIILNTFTNRLEIKAFSQTVLPNSITENIVIIDNKQYYQFSKFRFQLVRLRPKNL